MDIKDVKSIFLNIVKTWPQTGCSRPNTFFILNGDGTEFETENLKATYQDYLAGEFWQRDWVAAGANPDTLCKKYPIVGIEHKRVNGAGILDNKFCYEFWVVVVDVPDCEACPKECNRTLFQVHQDLFETAIRFLDELKKYELFKLTKDGETVQAWTTEAQVKYLLDSGQIDTASDGCNAIYLLLQDDKFDIQATSVGLTDGAQAVSFPVRVCGCFLPKLEPDFSETIPAALGVTKCPTC